MLEGEAFERKKVKGEALGKNFENFRMKVTRERSKRYAEHTS